MPRDTITRIELTILELHTALLRQEEWHLVDWTTEAVWQ